MTDCPNLVIEGIAFSTSSAHHTTTGIMGVTLNACTLRQGVVEKASTSPSTRTVMVPTATHRSDAGRAPPRSRNVGAEVVTPSFHGGVKAGTAQKPSLAPVRRRAVSLAHPPRRPTSVAFVLRSAFAPQRLVGEGEARYVNQR